MSHMVSVIIPLQEFVLTDSTGQVMARGEAVGPLFSFSNLGVMRWPITFCLLMVVILAARAALRIRSGEPEQKVLARAAIDGSLFWGAYAVALGVLGTVVGFMMAAQAVEALGQVETPLVWGGVKVALSTTVYGLLIFLLSAIVWFGLRAWHRKAALSGA
jgi:biopolymer transport protein ExbB/TolQ